MTWPKHFVPSSAALQTSLACEAANYGSPELNIFSSMWLVRQSYLLPTFDPANSWLVCAEQTRKTSG